MANDHLEEARREVVEFSRRMLREGLVKGTAGNVSVRVGDEVVITPGSVPYEEIEPDGLAIVDLDGNPISGGRPSSETPLHTLVYRESDAVAVVHTHSIYATTLACTVDELPAVHYMIHAFGGDSIAVSDYERFGSAELAAAVHAALGERRGVLLRNHGAVVHGPTLSRAYDLAVLLEWLAELYWRASVFGEPRILSHEQLEEVATEAQRRAYGAAAAGGGGAAVGGSGEGGSGHGGSGEAGSGSGEGGSGHGGSGEAGSAEGTS